MDIGYYSSKQAELGGVVLYETPDGQTVECTCIVEMKGAPPPFDDMICVGQVTKFIRRTSHGRFDDLLEKFDGLLERFYAN